MEIGRKFTADCTDIQELVFFIFTNNWEDACFMKANSEKKKKIYRPQGLVLFSFVLQN